MSKKNISICQGIAFCLIFLFAILVPAKGGDITGQIITHIDEILKENPLPFGKEVQMINIAHNDTISVFVMRINENFEIGLHFHKTHDETIYVIKGEGKMLVHNKWFNIKTGSIHFNPMGKVHSVKNTGNEPLVIISIFTPVMREFDRHFVQ